MKKITVIIILSLQVLFLQAQKKGSDVVYPIDNSKPLSKCVIHDIQNGNIVFFEQDGEEFRMEAIAVKKNGEYIDLSEFAKKSSTLAAPSLQVNNENGGYNGYDYSFYENIQKRAKSQKNTGMGLTLCGAGFFFIGVTLAVNSGYNQSTRTFDNTSKAATGGLLEIGGLIMSVVGLPVWISGGVKYRKATNGMYKCKNPNLSFNIGSTHDGVGLVLRF